MKQLLTFLVLFASFYASSQAVARITSPDQTICACDNAILSSSTSSPGSSPIVRTIWSVIGCGVNIADTTLAGQDLIIPLCTACTYDISIINQHQNGTASVAQAPQFITVNSNPTAGINAVVNSCTFPFGVTYSNTNPVPGITASWTFVGTTPTTFTGDNPPLMNYAAAGDYDVTLIVTNTLTGCKDTAFRTMNISNFDAEIILPTGILCEGEQLQFTDNSTVGANTWNWTFENGSPGSSSSQNPTASFPAGTHDVTLQSGNTNIGCNGIVTVQVTVLPKPTPSFTVAPTTGCAPLAADFTNTNIQGGATYVWNYGDPLNSTFIGSNSPDFTYLGNGSFTPTLTMTGSNGCTATVSGTPVVLTSPVAAFTQTENNLCEPKNVTFNPAGSTAPGPIATYTWIFGDGSPNVVNLTNATINHDYLCGEWTPSLVIEMESGCIDTVVGTEIKVGTPLNVGFEADTLLQCIKKPINLHSTTVIDCPHEPTDLIYFWSFENAPETGDSSMVKIFPDTMLNVSYATDVALQIDFRGCKSSDTIVDYIYIKAPVSKFALDTVLFCDPAEMSAPLGKVVTVDDLTSIYGHTNPVSHPLLPTSVIDSLVQSQLTDDVVVTYKWDDGTANTVIEDDTQLEDANKGETTHTFNQYGSYTVWQIIENRTLGCIDSTSRTVHVSWITTSYVFDIAGNDSICINNPFNFTSTSGTHGIPTIQPEPHSPLSYSFDMISGGTVTGSGSTVNQTFSHTYFTPGDYDVVLTTTNSVGCQATHTDHITAFALPVASFALSDSNGCIGITYNTVTTNNSTHPAGSFGFGNNDTGWAASDAFHWTINPNGGTITNPITDLRSETVSSPINSTTTFSLFVIDGFGCQSPSVSVTANVNKPTADFILPTDVCHGTTVVADASISSGTQPMTYAWFFNTAIDPTPDAVTQTMTNTLTSTGLSQTYQYCLVVRDGTLDQCPDDTCKTVTVSKPIADFTFVKDGASVDANGNFTCPPVVVDFTNTSQSVNAITNTNWHFNTQASGPIALPPLGPVTDPNNSPQGIQYLFAGTYDISLVIQDAIGCVDTLSIDNFLVIQGPSVDDTIIQAATVCGQSFTFDMSNEQNLASWSWDLGDGTIVSSADSTAPFDYTYTGVQTYAPVLTIVDAQNCAVSYFNTVVIQDNGVSADFTFTPDEINLGTFVTFDPTANSINGNVLTWNWNFGDGTDTSIVIPDLSISHQYFVGGEIPVTLTVTDDRGCTDDITKILTVDVRFDMPNVFTGFGSDGPNNELLLFADVFKDFEIVFVNRWGNVVYEGVRDATRARYLWDGVDQKSGKLCQDGTYYYILKGTLKNDVVIDIHGFVTLIASVRP